MGKHLHCRHPVLARQALNLVHGVQERLFQKAERLAPDLYSNVTQTVEQERIAHEAQKAAKVLSLLLL